MKSELCQDGLNIAYHMICVGHSTRLCTWRASPATVASTCCRSNWTFFVKLVLHGRFVDTSLFKKDCRLETGSVSFPDRRCGCPGRWDSSNTPFKLLSFYSRFFELWSSPEESMRSITQLFAEFNCVLLTLIRSLILKLLWCGLLIPRDCSLRPPYIGTFDSSEIFYDLGGVIRSSVHASL